MNRMDVIRTIEESRDLPSVNREMTEIIRMLSESETLNIEELADKISRCGGLGEALFAIINSGYFKLMRRIDSLSDAIAYLGMRTVERLIIVHLINSLFSHNLGKFTELSREKHLRHCLGASIAANMIAEKLGKPDIYKYFAYGLIHDIGVAVLDICVPDVIDEVVKMQHKGIHQIIAERLVMQGYTHSHSGALLCEKWNLPDDIRAIVEYHHTPLLAKDYVEEVNIMSVADSISTLYYERLLCMNTHYVVNEKSMEALGLTMEDLEKISEVLPQKIEEAIKIFNFKRLHV